MLKASLTAFAICLVGIIGQVDAQCSGSFNNFYQQPTVLNSGCSQSYIYSAPSYLNSCGSSSVSNPVFNNNFSPVNYVSAPVASRLPAPSFAQSSPVPSYVSNFTPAPTFQSAPFVSSVPQSVPISAPIASPISQSFDTGFNPTASFAAPSCANGNCPYR